LFRLLWISTIEEFCRLEIMERLIERATWRGGLDLHTEAGRGTSTVVSETDGSPGLAPRDLAAHGQECKLSSRLFLELRRT
jgi:hypothetical protein